MRYKEETEAIVSVVLLLLVMIGLFVEGIILAIGIIGLIVYGIYSLVENYKDYEK